VRHFIEIREQKRKVREELEEASRKRKIIKRLRERWGEYISVSDSEVRGYRAIELEIIVKARMFEAKMEAASLLIQRWWRMTRKRRQYLNLQSLRWNAALFI